MTTRRESRVVGFLDDDEDDKDGMDVEDDIVGFRPFAFLGDVRFDDDERSSGLFPIACEPLPLMADDDAIGAISSGGVPWSPNGRAVGLAGRERKDRRAIEPATHSCLYIFARPGHATRLSDTASFGIVQCR